MIVATYCPSRMATEPHQVDGALVLHGGGIPITNTSRLQNCQIQDARGPGRRQRDVERAQRWRHDYPLPR